MSPRSLPLDLKLQIVRDMGPGIDRHEYCRVLVGTLLHLANCTRPDIAFAAGILFWYSQSPCATHWEAALGVLRY